MTAPGSLLDTLRAFRERARGVLDDPAAVEELLEEARVQSAPSSALQRSLEPLRRLLRAYARGYRGCESADLSWALAAVMYVASPWDMAPDYLPGGLRDDEIAVGWVVERLRYALASFDAWEASGGVASRDSGAAPAHRSSE